MQDSRDEKQEGYRTAGMQDICVLGHLGRRTGMMQEGWNAETEECWKGVMQEKRDAGQEACRTRGMQDRRDAGN